MEARNYEDEFEMQDIPFPEARFTVDNDEKAEWVLERLRERKEKTDRFIRHYEAQIEKMKNKMESYALWAESLLRNYLESDLILVKETKTERKYLLPGGELKLKKQPLKYIKDDAALLEEIKQKQLAYIVTKESPDWAGLKKITQVLDDGTVILTTTGEVLESVKAEEQETKFTVTIKE